ncbi:MAG TPA: RluA family pseudouridine synthase [Alphaproteobacteria bacterium]|nr:RluA family pseudouridine synthase [Alphaproteobacteria bacterium]
MSGVQTLEVGPEDTETRLDRWFRRRFPEVPHVRLQKLLRTGQIRVDGKRADAGTRLAAGQKVRVPPLGDTQQSAPAGKRPVSERDAADLRKRVLFRDDWVIVIDKPSGLAVQGGSGTDRHLDGMLDALAFGGERPRLVHRLDRDTSGVLVLARTAEAARRLGESFRGKSARKYYWAVTVGVPVERQGRIDAALLKRAGARGERVVLDDEDGRAAVTLYSVVDHAAHRAAWVALWPLTGRTHQLRVHMAAIGTPILGDLKYGGPAARLEGGEVGRGLHLHARRIILSHPSGRGRIDVTAPLSPHMRETWKSFGFSMKDDGDPFAEIED